MDGQMYSTTVLSAVWHVGRKTDNEKDVYNCKDPSSFQVDKAECTHKMVMFYLNSGMWPVLDIKSC